LENFPHREYFLWGGEDKGEWWRGEFKYDIFDIL
jgi:hypothetical protein